MQTVLDAHKGAPVVLVADDDATLRLLMREALRQADFSVVDVGDGKRALETFSEIHPDVVLLDVNMPGMDGFSVCEAIRQSEHGRHIPILMVTGLDDLESVNRAYEAGATDFIVKPIHWPLLGHRVRYMLRASHAIRDLHISEGRNRALVEASPDSMLRLSEDGVFLDYHAGHESRALMPTGGLRGRQVSDILPPEDAGEALGKIREALRTGATQSFEFELTYEGDHRYFEARIVASGDHEVLCVLRDVTNRKAAEDRMRDLAYYDVLTGLPNRQHFGQSLKQALELAKRHNYLVALMFIDLDQFKRINDTLGHSVGDGLLKSVGERLLACLRGHDVIARQGEHAPGSSVARLGGDEFTVMLTRIGHANDAAAVADRILKALSQPVVLDGHEIVVTPSIGIAVCPTDGTDPETLVKNADTAMYHAKAAGRNDFRFYTESMSVQAMTRLDLEGRLRKALERDEFVIHYQPQVDVEAGRVIGVEALVRWQSPELGLLMPDEFIPLLEESGMIVGLGDWVLRTACAQVKAWEAAGLPLVKVAVNVSGEQFRHDQLRESVSRALADSGLDPSYLELEFTERVIMQDVERAIVTLEAIKAMGIGLSVDDFGTGYSALGHLKRFPLDIVKIDDAFVRDVTENSEDAKITGAIIAMAHGLKLRVVAKGIETRRQQAVLERQGSDVVQGYLFGKPLPASECAGVLATQRLEA